MTVDDSRAKLKTDMREKMGAISIPEVTDVKFIDGRVPGDIEKYIKDNNFIIGNGFHRGELGIWFSTINSWRWLVTSDYDALIVMEDDATISESKYFSNILNQLISLLPKDWDFTTLFVPNNQTQDYFYDRLFNSNGGWELRPDGRGTNGRFEDSPQYIGNVTLVRSYQGYSNVSVMYSKSGAQKLLNLIDKNGIRGPVDCWLYEEEFKPQGNINGYAPAPHVLRVVEFTEMGTIARNSGMYML